MTYKQVAQQAGITNVRIVGFALHANKDPQSIPCHRVVSTKGNLTGYAFGGIKKKQEILIKEGVVFMKEKVDLVKSRYSLTL